MSDMEKYSLEEIKEAAREAAREGAKEGVKECKLKRGGSIGASIVGTMVGKFLFIGIIVLVLVGVGVTFVRSLPNYKEQLQRESKAEEHDLVLEDDGFLGYTAADFAEAILGDQSKIKKIEVLQQEVSDAATLLDTGLWNVKLFSKSQIITYHGTVTYTVDLADIKRRDITLDKDEKVITIAIPCPVMEPINIQSENIEFGDVEKGFLAFGEMKATPEEMAEIQSKAQGMMEAKIRKENVGETAKRFAKMVVWEIYQPIINGVEKGYSLIVEIKEDK